MGRKPIIREAILNVLKKSKTPLRFKEIREGVALEMGRDVEKVRDQNISDNLSVLVEQGEIEEKSVEGKNVYCPSNSFYKTKNKMVLKSILDEADLDEFYPIFEDKNPPLTAYFQNLEKLTDPLRNKTVQHFCPSLNNWSEPVDLIRRRMLESYTDLEPKERIGIANLLAYAYWYGVQELVKNYGFAPLEQTLERSRSFALTCIENAKERQDLRRIDAEHKIIEILDITKGILLTKNLKDLLLLFEKYSLQVKKLQSELLSLTGEFMAAGETIFDGFKEFHFCTLVGLEAAGLIPKGVRKQDLPPKYRYLVNFSDVWDDIISSIISEYNTDEILESINGDSKETLNNIVKCKRHLFSLMDLPFRSKMFVFYVWGYPEIFEVSNKDFLPLFDQWLSALKDGFLDHRSWIFEVKSVTTLINTYKEVKKGKPPQNGIIDIEPWTISDLYTYHPRGKDVGFWKELLVEINSRLQQKHSNKKLSRDIEAVLEGAY